MELEKLLREKKKQVKELKTREEELEIATRQLMIDQEKIAAKEKKLQQEEKQMNAFTNQLIRKEELFTQQLAVSSKREKGIQEEAEKINQIKKQLISGLGKIIPMNKEEAKKNLLVLLKEEFDRELERYKEEEIKQAERRIK